jgi:predicted nucleotidyltransferase
MTEGTGMDLSIVAGSRTFSPENRKDSDFDLLIILENAGKRRIRIEEFIREIEMKHDDLAQQLFRDQGLSCELSPYIVTLAYLEKASVWREVVEN